MIVRKEFIPLYFTLLIWILNVFQFISGYSLSSLGISPREQASLIGILTAPMIHGSWEHLLSNTLPLLILGTLLFIMYGKIALRVWTLIYIFSGAFVWVLARGNSVHVGASGVIYGLASFLFFSGFFRMDIRSIAIALGVSLFYGGMVWGILPLQEGVSWESHLFGGIVGLALAYFYRNQRDETEQTEPTLEQTERKSFEKYLQQRDFT